MAETEMTLGEIARRLARQEQEIGGRLDRQEVTLDVIRSDVQRINGSIAETRILQAAHGAKLAAHDIELRDLKDERNPGGEGIYIPINGKMIAALLLAFVTIAGALATAWMQGAAQVGP